MNATPESVNGLYVSEVRFDFAEPNVGEGRHCLALCSFTLNDQFAVKYVRIVRMSDGRLIVAMPSHRVDFDIFRDHAHAVSQKCRDMIIKAILDAYQATPKALPEFAPLGRRVRAMS